MNKNTAVVRAIDLVRINHQMGIVIETLGANGFVIDYSGGSNPHISLMARGDQWMSRIKIPAIGGKSRWRSYANINALSWIEEDSGEVEFNTNKQTVAICTGGLSINLDRIYEEEDDVEFPRVSHKIRFDAFKNLVRALDFNKPVIENEDYPHLTIQTRPGFLTGSTNDRYVLAYSKFPQPFLSGFSSIFLLKELKWLASLLRDDFMIGSSGDQTIVKENNFELSWVSNDVFKTDIFSQKKVRNILKEFEAKSSVIHVKIDRKKLTAFNKKVRRLVGEGYRHSRLVLDFKKAQGQVVLTSELLGSKLSMPLYCNPTADLKFEVSFKYFDQFIERLSGIICLEMKSNGAISLSDNYRYFIFPKMND